MAINFADPSGSSPRENHPGNTRRFVFPKSSANSSLDCIKFSGLRVLKTSSSTLNQAFNNDCLVSNSELLPGNTGMRAVGCSLSISFISRDFLFVYGLIS